MWACLINQNRPRTGLIIAVALIRCLLFVCWQCNWRWHPNVVYT